MSFTSETGSRPRRRVIVADDHRDLREMYAWCLRAAGWIVAEAGDGLDVMSVAASFQPDAVVMDLYLPVVDGVEAIRRLRAETWTADVCIVVCTAARSREMELRARAAGCNEYRQKPFSPDDLCKLLGEITPEPRR